jgi:Holliday junction resolvase RusA-like endonuclease
MELFIPCYPPSANSMWGYAKGRVYKTGTYNKWLDTAGYIIKPQIKLAEMITVPYKIAIQMRRDSKADLDNCIKPINDLMQLMGVVENDNLCEMVTARWVTEGYDGLYVRIEPAGVE